MEAKERYVEWLRDSYFDDDTKNELRNIFGEEAEIEERFYKDLEFGTAGLRGIMGAGTNRMNIYTVRKATQGLANYILKIGGEDKGVAIAYDSRHMSPEFADEAALCLNANGIKAYVFESLRPTPELSFAIRHLKCIAGINITASHNPSNYNGYKVYWEDGAQITPPHDTGIMDCVNAIANFSEVKTMDKEEAKEAGLYITIGKKVDDAYIEEVKKLIMHPKNIKAMKDELVIVYSPLHGAGKEPVMRILNELGFSKVYIVEEQAEPDGDFPTVKYPNPESADAYELGLKLAREKHADLILATDPDADRLGAYVYDDYRGGYFPMTGNMIGVLLANYILGAKRIAGQIPADGAVVRSIVTTNMLDALAEKYNVELVEVLTGFKYIGEVIKKFEDEGKGTYLFGMEESYGCLAGTYARDKDAVAAAVLLCEAACYYMMEHKTLWDALFTKYDELGHYRDSVMSITMEGKEGLEKIASIMEKLRKEPLEKIGEWKVLAIRDYLGRIRKDMVTEEETVIKLPSANVLYYELEDKAWVCIRPSGTEPKIKVYFGVVGEKSKIAEKLLWQLEDAAKELLS